MASLGPSSKIRLPWSSGEQNGSPELGATIRVSSKRVLSKPFAFEPRGEYAKQARHLFHSTTNQKASVALIHPVIPLLKDGAVHVQVLDAAATVAATATSRATELRDRTNGSAAIETAIRKVPDLELQRVSPLTDKHLMPAAPPGATPRMSLNRLLLSYDYESSKTVQPRGLINQSNMCFLNSVLQVLIHSRLFYALLMAIKDRTLIKIKSDTPVLDGLVNFASQYSLKLQGSNRPTSAESFYATIYEHPNFRHLERGRQEDAQEFMGYLLDTLEQNFEAATPSDAEVFERAVSGESEGTARATDAGWTHIGRHNKPLVAREAGRNMSNNPIQELFGGKLRSVLRKGSSLPSVTLDPFQQLPLDVSADNIHTVQQALNHMIEPEKLQLEHKGRLIEAVKTLEFEKVPRILVLYLKRFTFINRGDHFDFGKISKPIAVDSVLTVPYAGRSLSYRPFAIVYHHGPSATVGHYTADVLFDDVWYNIDDDLVYAQGKPSTQHSAAYMVFYEEMES